MTQMTQLSPVARYDTPMPSTLRKHQPDNDDGHNNDEWEYMPWGQALAYYRNRAGITQKGMAKAVGYKGASTAGTWEARHAPLNNDYLMKRLADLLDVDPDVLAEGRIPRHRHDPKSELQAAGDAAAQYLPLEKARVLKTVMRIVFSKSIEDQLALIEWIGGTHARLEAEGKEQKSQTE